MKKFFDIFVIVLMVLVGLLLARNIVVRALVENGVKMVTGMPLTIKKLDIGLVHGYMNIENLVVKNPAGFHDTILVDIPKIFVSYERLPILKGMIHLKDLVFELRQFNVVENEKKLLNLDSLTALQGQKGGEKKPSQPPPQQKDKTMALHIDHFHLKVDKASFIDYTSGSAVVKDFNVGLDENFQDITNPNKLVALIVFKVMTKTPLALLSNFNVSDLEGSISGIAGSASAFAGQMADQGLNTFKNKTKNAMPVVEKTGETLKETAGFVEEKTKALSGSVTGVASSLKKKIKIPF